MNIFGLNTQQSYLLFLLLVALRLFSYSVQSMRFDLSYGKEARCFSEDVMKNSVIVGNYSIVNTNEVHPLPPNHTITVQVSTNGDGSSVIHRAERVQSGQLTFTTYQNEEYIICFFSTTDDPQVTLSIHFEWRTGVKALGRPNIAKRNQIDKMIFEIQIMHEKALSIKEEMSYLLQRNEEMLELNWITDNRMFLWTFVSLFVTFSVAGLQVWHLKTFFQKKKLI